MINVNKKTEAASVTVVIPCFDCAETIERAVQSVLTQTLLPTEIILIDDNSLDSTAEHLDKIKKECEECKITIIQFSTNGGPSVARNAGWDRATTKYIAFLDADDSWHPQKIELQYTWMNENKHVDLTAHHTSVSVGGNIVDPIVQFGDNHAVSSKNLLFSNRIATSSVMAKQSLTERFDPTRKFSEDYLLWLELSLNGTIIHVLESTLSCLHKERYGKGGLSSQLWSMEKGELSNYKLLHKEQRINICQRTFYSLYSMLKFTRRLILARLRLNK
ncbi:MAG: glycosyltransferase involved in cell wall biosynthesis [Phycisphaerales bacterium]|jgi:glycosyltransferase involved in cell wall biosynthesis